MPTDSDLQNKANRMLRLLKCYKGKQEKLRLQAQALEEKHQKEFHLREETEYALDIERKKVENLKLQLQILKKEHNNMRLTADMFESNYIEEVILRGKLEIDLEELKQVLETSKREEENRITSHVRTWKEKYEEELRLREETGHVLAIERERIEKLKLQIQSLEKEHDDMRLTAEEFESKYREELILRKESEIMLESNKFDEMKQQHEDCKIEEENLNSQIRTWQDKFNEESSLRKETEDALTREKEELELANGVLESYIEEADAMREERDNALKIVEEITTKQLELRQPPKSFFCPITLEVMKDPHIAADGFTYEAEAFRKWLSTGHITSPMTNLKLPHRTLIPNRTLRSTIEEFGLTPPASLS